MADGKLKILQMYGKMSKITEHLFFSQPSQNFMESGHVPQGAGTDEPADRSKLIEIEKERRPRIMYEAYEFLKKCGTYYLATVDGDQPRVRPFGTVDLYDGTITIQTGKSKDVSKQMEANPKIEICAFNGDEWIRICAKAVADDSVEAVDHMLDAYPHLRSMYTPGDGNSVVYKLTEAVATISSFTAAPKTFEW